MLKKTLSILGFLVLLMAVVRLFVTHTTHAEEAATTDPCKPGEGQSYSDVEDCLPFSSGRILSKINPGALEKNLPELFATSDPEKAGQNLYMTIYAQTAVAPETKAAKNISGRYGVTEAEMTQMLYGNISPILKRKPLITQEEAIQKTAQIQKQFQEEKDILALKADIESSVTPSEIFINGDLSDSGFDLVDDLSLIEKMLFNKAVPPTVGGNFEVGGDGSGGAGGSLNQPSNNAASNPSYENVGEASSADQSGQSSHQSDGVSSGSSSSGQDKIGKTLNNVGSPGSSGIIFSSPADNPNICFDQNTLDQALQQFTQEQTAKGSGAHSSKNGQGQKTLQGQSGGSIGNNSNTADHGGEGQTGTSTSALTGDDPLPDLGSQAAPTQVKSAPAAQWLKGGDCKDPFCLSVNFVKKPVELYQNTDNCILCHLEKINAKLRETVNHSLIPGKATGNLLEPQICKKAAKNLLESVGLNFYAMSKPVQTPANDDLIYGASIEEEFKSFLSTYKPFPISELNAKSTADGGVEVPPSESDHANASAVAAAGPTTTLDQVQKTVEAELNTNNITRQSQITIAENALQSDVDVGFYQGIRREIEQMNYYFDSFKDVLHSLHEKVEGISGEQACTSLKNKKQCE